MTRPQSRGTVVLGVLVGAALVWLAASRGLWAGPLVASFLWALATSSRRTRLLGALALSVLGYAAPLVAAAIGHEPVAATAADVAAIMGFGRQALVPWALTAVLCLAQAAAGGWLGHAFRSLAAAPTAPRYVLRR